MVENVQKRANVCLIADPAKSVCSVSKASYKRSSIMDADLAMVENVHAKAVLLKAITVGCTILEFAKLVMYEFYYDCLLPSFGDRLRLFHRHGQLRLSRRERGLVSELGAIADRWLDTSNFERAHPLYSSTNFRALCKFKSETVDVPPTEFCGLRSKMYLLSMLTGDQEYRKAKGVPKLYVKKHVTQEQYLHVLNRVTTRIMSSLSVVHRRQALPAARCHQLTRLRPL